MESITNMKEEVGVKTQKKELVDGSCKIIDETKGSDETGPQNKCSKKKTKKVRCHQCNVKCGMMSFNCECGHTFCSKHVTRVSHNCIKIEENNEKKKKEIENKLPLTEFSKFEKI